VPRVYSVSRRQDIHGFILDAVRASGGTILYASDPGRAPIYVGLQGSQDERLGLLIYPFRMTRRSTAGRPDDEVRGQLRYGTDWHNDDHVLGRDIAGVDTTLLLGVYPEGPLFVGLDPALYDPLPLGISFYAKDAQVADVMAHSWTVWERENRGGDRRQAPRAQGGHETLVGFSPARLLDYVRFERQSSDLGLDPPLRYAAAQNAAQPVPIGGAASPIGALHDLESDFDLNAQEILQIISERMRLTVAVRGGVAEFHLEKHLDADPQVTAVQRLDLDSQPDFRIELSGSRKVLVECKNTSPATYSNGDFKVEIQKGAALLK